MEQMILVYSTKQAWSAIAEGAKIADDTISSYTFTSNQTLKETLVGYQKLHPSILILDLSEAEEAAYNEIIRDIQSFRILSEATRIIIISTKLLEPGNKLISSIVDLWISDILVEADLTVIPDKLATLIKSPANYRSAARWQRMTVEAERREAVPVKETVKVVTKTETIIKHVNSKLIVIASLTERAGSSLMALNLARYLSKGKYNVALMELPLGRPMLYTMARMDVIIPENYEGSEIDRNKILDTFVSLPHDVVADIDLLRRDTPANIDGNLVYYVLDPEKPIITQWTAEHTATMARAASANTVTVVDAGRYLKDPSIRPLLTTADAIIGLVEPVVTEWWYQSESMAFAIDLKKNGYPIHFVANKTTGKSHVGEFEGMYKLKTLPIPYVAPELVQASINEGKYLVDRSKELAGALTDITRQTLGTDFIPNTRKKIFG